MEQVTTRRLEELERTTEELAERLARLESRAAPAIRVARPKPGVPDPSPSSFSPPRAPAPPRATASPPPPPRPEPASASAELPKPVPRPAVEDLLAGRVLAWAGGLAVLVGIVLLFAVAVSRGWIGEGARTLMAALASSALVTAGAWLHERRGRTDASLAATAAGLGGLFVTTVVASRVYELVPIAAGTLLALATGVVATVLALRFRAPGIAALGILGGLAAPVLVGAPQDGGTTAVLLAATVAAAALCVRERWSWLAIAAYAVVTPQWLAYLAGDPATSAALLTLTGFGALAAAGAVGFELRERSRALRPVAVVLLALNAFVLGAAGWLTLDGHPLWLVALAATHLGLGVALLRHERASQAVGVVACALGAVLADLALSVLLDDVALTVGWSAVAVGFAPLVRRLRPMGLTGMAAGAGLGAHLALALTHVLVVDAPPELVSAGAPVEASAWLALLVLAATCFASGAVLGERPQWRVPLHVLGLTAVAYLAAATLDGAALVAAWSVEAVLLAELARRTGDRLAGTAAAAHVALAVLHGVAHEARLTDALSTGPADLTAAAVALIAVAVAAWRTGAAAAHGTVADGDPAWRLALHGLALAALAYLAAQALDGPALVVAWAVLAVALAEAARLRRPARLAFGSEKVDDGGLAGIAAATLLLLAAAHAIAFEAPPQALLDGLADPLAALVALGAAAAVAWRCAVLALSHDADGRALAVQAATAGALIALHLASTELVTAAGAGPRAQALLSALWGVAGVGALLAGLLRDVAPLRTGALALLLAALAKVFLYDLATLTPIARVVSFIVLGLLLLLGAFAWQRIRPRVASEEP